MEIGKLYLVPCLEIPPDGQSGGRRVRKWMPVLGNAYNDDYHVDWRFADERLYKELLSRFKVPNNVKVITKYTGKPVLKWKKLKRLMPQFPLTELMVFKDIEHGYQCKRLMDGRLIPRFTV